LAQASGRRGCSEVWPFLSASSYAGAELFTGNNLIAMAWADRRITTRQVLRNWTAVYAANFAGAAVMNGADVLSSLWWQRIRQLPSSHHRETAIGRRLIDAAAAEPDNLLKQLGSAPEGLTTEVASQRLAALGPNLVAHERQQNLVEELIGRARNPLNFLLLSLAAISYFLGDSRAASVIAVMVLLSVFARLRAGASFQQSRGAASRDGANNRDSAAAHRGWRASDRNPD